MSGLLSALTSRLSISGGTTVFSRSSARTSFLQTEILPTATANHLNMTTKKYFRAGYSSSSIVITTPMGNTTASSRSLFSPLAMGMFHHRHKALASLAIPPPQQKRFRSNRSRRGLYNGKDVRFGNAVSFSNRKTRRKFKPNMFKKRVYSETLDEMIRFHLTTSTLRAIDKAGGLDNYLLTSKYVVDGEGLVHKNRILERKKLLARLKHMEDGRDAKMNEKEEEAKEVHAKG